MTMKRWTALVLAAVLALCLVGCGASDGEALKLCRIEITDLTGAHDPVTLAELSQEDLNDFLGAADWEGWETDAPDGLTPQYWVEVYQDATKTVLGEDAPEALKILEYVTYMNTDVVKCTVAGDILPEEVVKGFLKHYSIAPPTFFAALNEAMA